MAEVIAWLQGTSYSTVLASGSDKELDGENAHLRSPAGEELRLRELRGSDNWSAIGFRHDFPDPQGRLWRTEGVLRRLAAEGGQNLIRLRTQCLAGTPSASLERPRKPYLIKALLKNGWGGADALLLVSDQPVWLADTDEGLGTARAVTLGEATKWLPTVYISAKGNRAWHLSQGDIERLAYDLGGIAHVVVEPDRAFSFRLRDETGGRNVYGGAVGLAAPGQGIIRRYHLGWRVQDENELAAAVKEAVTSLRGQMPAFGWDWTELQERALRAQREAYKGALSAAESDALFNDYIKQLEDLRAENRQLQEQLRSRPVSSEIGTDEEDFSNENLVGIIGPEFYSGEISDRLRLAAKTTLSVADQIGLDARSKVILHRIVDRLPVSPALRELLEDLARATKDPIGLPAN
ncbi:MAG: hypothetical protein HC834_11120 [Rhodospirillales bacterium]|nr:hypothetical protein [Rhodospirillales bacterium]